VPRKMQKHDVGVQFRKRKWIAETAEQADLLRDFFIFIQAKLSVNELLDIPDDRFGYVIEQIKTKEQSISELKDMDSNSLYNFIAGVSDEEEAN